MGDLSVIRQVVVFSVYFEKRSKYEVSSGLAPDPPEHALDLDSPKLNSRDSSEGVQGQSWLLGRGPLIYSGSQERAGEVNPPSLTSPVVKVKTRTA